MEAEKSHDRPYASWRTKRASSMAQFRSESLRTREAGGVSFSPRLKAFWCKSQSPKTREPEEFTSKWRRASQFWQRNKIHPSSACLFVPSEPSAVWMVPAHVEDISSPLSPPTHTPISSKIPAQAHLGQPNQSNAKPPWFPFQQKYGLSAYWVLGIIIALPAIQVFLNPAK